MLCSCVLVSVAPVVLLFLCSPLVAHPMPSSPAVVVGVGDAVSCVLLLVLRFGVALLRRCGAWLVPQSQSLLFSLASSWWVVLYDVCDIRHPLSLVKTRTHVPPLLVWPLHLPMCTGMEDRRQRAFSPTQDHWCAIVFSVHTLRARNLGLDDEGTRCLGQRCWRGLRTPPTIRVQCARRGASLLFMSIFLLRFLRTGSAGVDEEKKIPSLLMVSCGGTPDL